MRAGVGEQPGDQVVAGLAGVGGGEPVEVGAEFGVDLGPSVLALGAPVWAATTTVHTGLVEHPVP
ncbi:hypothetical protein [Dactylosporangium sp. NPDC005555]|uniref:hypothetical protein n=1 Tax=Dactylosporangium sp. NPDC005555 TaxID=3154889 RepID=UPI0033B5CFD1